MQNYQIKTFALPEKRFSHQNRENFGKHVFRRCHDHQLARHACVPCPSESTGWAQYFFKYISELVLCAALPIFLYLGSLSAAVKLVLR